MKRNIIAGAILALAGILPVSAQTNSTVKPGAADNYRPTVSVLGDSYSTFQYFVHPSANKVWYTDPVRSYTDVADVTQTWWHRYITENGYKLGLNNSYSGSTICNTDYNGGDATEFSFVTRYDDLGNPDIIFVFGGTNDAWAGVPMGEYKYDGFVNGDLYQYRPALAWLLDRMIKRYPSTEIYFILNDQLGTDVPEATDEICAHYGIPVIKLSDIDKREGHPTVKGMEQIATQVDEAVKAIKAGR